MRIQHNIMAMSAYRNYTNNVSAMKKNLEKLSSGYKINRAGDDAAGLAISEKMRAQITGLETAQKNAKDGISLVQTAEGALTEVHDMLNRMVELATQSANGTYDNTTDRKQLQKEMDKLLEEIDRIADSANFNGIELLNGKLDGESAAKVENFDMTGLLPDVGKTNGTDTVLHQDPATDTTGTTFSVDLHNTVFKNGDGDEMTLTVGGDKVSVKLEGAAGNEALSGGDLVDAIIAKITADNADGNAEVSIDGQVFTVAKGTSGDNRITFTQKTAPTNSTEEVKGDYAVNITGSQGAVGSATAVGSGAGGGGGTPAVKAVYESAEQTLATTGGTAAFTAAGTLPDGFGITAAPTGTDGDVKVKYEDVTAATASATGADALAGSTFSYGADGAAGNFTIKFVAGAAESGAWDDTNKVLTVTLDGTNGGTGGVYSNSDLETVIQGLTGLGAGAPTVTGITVTGALTADLDATAGTGDLGSVTMAGGADAGKKVTVTTPDGAEDTQNFTTAAWTGTVNITAGGVTATFDTTQSWDGTEATVGSVATTGGSTTGATMTIGGHTYTTVAADTDLAKQLASFAADYNANATDKGVWEASVDGNKIKFTAKTAGAFGSAGAPTGAPTGTNQVTPGADAVAGGGGAGGGAAGGDTTVVIGTADFNTQTTAIKNVTADSGQRLASTTFSLTSDMITDGGTLTAGKGTYTFTTNEAEKNGTGKVYIGDLVGDDGKVAAADLSKVADRITDAAKGNSTYTVGNVGGKMTFVERQNQTDYSGTAALNSYENIEKTFAITTKAPASSAGHSLTLQIGDTAKAYNQLKVDIKDMHAEALGLKGLKINEQDLASDAINKIKDAINTVSDVRGTLGATQNRLDHTINNLSVMTENIQDAESTIRDVDVAEEMMAYTKNNILIQSAQAMLAQANQVPQGVLQLLQ